MFYVGFFFLTFFEGKVGEGETFVSGVTLTKREVTSETC